MKRSALSTAVVAVAAALLAAVLWPLARWYTYDASHDINRDARDKVRKVAGLRAEDVQEMAIHASCRRDRRAFVILHGATDRGDIERVLKAVRGIYFSKGRLTWGSPWHDRIYIDGYTDARACGLPGPPSRKVRLRTTLILCLDPSSAPVISPTMRSADLGKVVEDILKRKGQMTPLKHSPQPYQGR